MRASAHPRSSRNDRWPRAARRRRATWNSRRVARSDSVVRIHVQEQSMTARIALRAIVAFALLCMELECPAQSAHPDQEPLGVGLEGFVYPYPVQYLTLRIEGADVKMAFMDVEPIAPAN